MGPLFSVALLSVIGLFAIALAFFITRFFLPSRSAAFIAFAFVAGSAFGGLFLILVHWLMSSQEEFTNPSQVMNYLGQLIAASFFFGCIFAGVIYRKFIKRTASASTAS